MTAREVILGRIRQALGETPADVSDVPRSYRTADQAPTPGTAGLLDMLVDRLVDYHALVRRTEPGGVAAAIAAAVAERGSERIVVPAGFPAQWLGSLTTIPVYDEPVLSPAELDDLDGVLTTCAVAVAETGTVVLDSSAGQGRRALTLVPDYHLIVVRADQVVASVPQALERLAPTDPLTWISGPSATSDIELSRVEGVHGPRTLEVLLVS